MARFGAAWLGRDIESGHAVAQLPVSGFDAGALNALTAEPRRYGFHATLKPPFALAPGRTEAQLLDAVAHLANIDAAFALPSLRLAAIGRFLALVPAAACPRRDEGMGHVPAAQAGLPRPGHGVERGGDAVGGQLAIGIQQRHLGGHAHAGPGHELTLERVAMQIDDAGQDEQPAGVPNATARRRRRDPFAVDGQGNAIFQPEGRQDAPADDGQGMGFMSRHRV